MPLPYLTHDFAGVGGVIKQRPEDFFVQEIPLYEPSGEGEHVYCEIQKIGMTTFEAIHRVAESLGVSSRDIGYAGMKDANALTRQIFSIPGVTPQQVMDLHRPDLAVQWAARHGNKLRLGHLRGNRFAVKIREIEPANVVRLRPVLDVLERRGLANYFGEQRFGRRGDNAMLGAALIRNDPQTLLKHLLGSPNAAIDDNATLQARTASDAGDFEKAMKLFPRRSGMERRILARLIKTRKPAAAVRAVDEKLRRLWVSALQSAIFNQVVADRIESLDRLMDGDLAWKHDNGACFRVESAAVEQPRCDAFEISPTGPLVGYRMTWPEGKPLEIEQSALGATGLGPNEFRGPGHEKAKGTRRPLRVRPTQTQLEAGVDGQGQYIAVAFTLPAGSFATILLRELMKSPE